jgi:hypothetical protein
LYAFSTDATTPKLLVVGSTGNVQLASGGKVGIGTGSPTSLLHIKSTATADLKMDGTTGAELIQPNAANMTFTVGGASGDLVFRAGSSTEYMRIHSQGGVGIGTAAPATMLHVSGVARGISPYVTIDRPALSADAGVLFRTSGVPSSQWFLGKAGSLNNDDLTISYGDAQVVNQRLNLTAAGNVGIGTTAPASMLHVSGVARGVSPYVTIDRPALTADAGVLFRTSGVPNSQWFIGKPGSLNNEDFTISYGDAQVVNQRLNLTAAGNVGIGRSVPLAKLDVNGAIKGNSHLAFMPWTTLALTAANGFVRLITPIADHEGGAFSLHLFGYTYTGGQAVDIRCGGFASAASGLTNPACTATGTDLPIELTTEPVGGLNYVVVRIGYNNTAWSSSQFSVEYDGTVAHDAAGFTWSVLSGTSIVPTNMNNVAVRNDGGGFVTIGQPTAANAPDPTIRLVVHGGVTVDGNIGAKYQDVAEWVPVAAKLTPGTVVIVSPDKKNEVMASTHAYDTAVAGVVSAQPGLILGEGSDSKAQIATTGRVKVHVDATKHAIRAGDLLVTGNKPGMAMFSEPIDVAGIKLHRPGTLVGKALEPLENGEGDILVLLSLQ